MFIKLFQSAQTVAETEPSTQTEANTEISTEEPFLSLQVSGL
jgi:hypothetical protein